MTEIVTKLYEAKVNPNEKKENPIIENIKITIEEQQKQKQLMAKWISLAKMKRRLSFIK